MNLSLLIELVLTDKRVLIETPRFLDKIWLLSHTGKVVLEIEMGLDPTRAYF